MLVLKEDRNLLLLALKSDVDKVREEMRESGYQAGGRVDQIMSEQLERCDRIILRLESPQKPEGG
jgi:hypothetical protein